ncbi:MAG: hypothetical protein IJ262_05735 [Clostridia bacterium]|nr:hypothetical protein [Clostridia bacterium]
MQIKIIAFFRKIIASLMAFFMSLGVMGGGDEAVERPEENTVTAYNEEAADYNVSIDASEEIHDISEILYGVFFEDINFAADGGLYAEKVINRSFDYFDQAQDDKLHGWSAVGNAKYFVEESETEGLNVNNTSYLVINNESGVPSGVANKGFLEGMSCEEGENYKLSLYAKADSFEGKIYVKLMAGEAVAAEGEIKDISSQWKKYSLTLPCRITANENVKLQVLCDNGTVCVDMVSLFPEKTYKERENGLRKDLAEMVAELEPKFLRFPGGCVIEGYDIESAYNWKNSIGVGPNGLPLEFNGTYGDVATRVSNLNLWTNVAATDDILPCFMSYGLGFFEYFQFAEDIGAIGVPVLNCGLYCQARGRQPVDMESEEFEKLLQDMVDLVEFCRGDVDSTWGKVRASLGHPEAFDLKYIGIGNENEGENFYERYEVFLERFLEEKEKNPELYEGLELIYSSGFTDGTHSINHKNSYVNAAEWLKENPGYSVNDFAGATDHHYYNDPDWFFKNVDYYDEENYKRNVSEMTETTHGGAIGVFLGEYAAKSNRLESALAEAAYMTGLERNGDIVKMAAYAPLFGNLTATHWAPDLIWFNNHLATGSINYYVQKIFSVNAGTTLLKSETKGGEIAPTTLKGMVGLGTWYTTAEFDNLEVVDNKTGKVLAKECFTLPNFWWKWKEASPGEWSIKNGKLIQAETELAYHNLGASAFYGDTKWTDYTYTVEATKTGGAEGFFIPFAVEDENNCLIWNIGGWGNTRSAVQQMKNGNKTGELPETITDFVVEEGRTYEIKLVISGDNAKGYIDGELQFDISTDSSCNSEFYHVVSTDETGDVIIKLVNRTGEDRTFSFNVEGTTVESKATVYQVAGDSLDNDNILGAEEDCIMKEFEADGMSDKFNYTVPQYSVTVIRLHK